MAPAVFRRERLCNRVGALPLLRPDSFHRKFVEVGGLVDYRRPARGCARHPGLAALWHRRFFGVRGSATGSALYPCCDPTAFTVSSSRSADWLITVGPRAGVLVTPALLLYGTGGFSA